MRVSQPVQAPVNRHGFTVIELMLSVAIMTVIVIGLYTVFDATQRALRSTMSQVDVFEGIRATTDLMVRDLEGAVPVRMPNSNLVSFAAGVPARSFFGGPANPANMGVELQGLRTGSAPILRTALQELFFINRKNDLWTAIGYWVAPLGTNTISAPVSVGRLFRFEYRTNSMNFATLDLYNRFNSHLRLDTSQLVIEGVVHLRVIAYDFDGKPLVRELGTNTLQALRPWFTDGQQRDETAYAFGQKWLKLGGDEERLWATVPPFPASLELEIGVLEPPLVTRYASIPSPEEARKYLARNAGKIHLFRQRIPLRNASMF